MSKLDEIEAAAEALPLEEKQQLMLFLATRLRGQGVRVPEPRKFSREQMAGWIAEDEADTRSLEARRREPRHSFRQVLERLKIKT